MADEPSPKPEEAPAPEAPAEKPEAPASAPEEKPAARDAEPPAKSEEPAKAEPPAKSAKSDEPADKELAAAPPSKLEPRTEGVVFRSHLAGSNYALNIIVGVFVCAGTGWFMGRVLGSPLVWLLAGILMAFAGAFFGRRKGEWRPVAVEAEGSEHRATVLLGMGRERKVAGSEVRSVHYEAEGDADAAQTHWVVLEGQQGMVGCVRARTREDALQLVTDLCATLNVPRGADMGPTEPEPETL